MSVHVGVGSRFFRTYPHVLQMDADASLASPQQAHLTVVTAADRKGPLPVLLELLVTAAPVERCLGLLCADVLLPPDEYTTIALPGSLNRRAISACNAAASIDALCLAPPEEEEAPARVCRIAFYKN